MSRKVLIAIGAVVVVVAAAALFLFVIAPAGSSSAALAGVDHVKARADSGSAKVLVEQDWGKGRLVLLGYDVRGVRRLGLGFASKGIRGWRMSSYTEKPVEPDDVVVGSLLVANSAGGSGQPAWSAAVGELVDTRIDRVEVSWASGDKSIGPRTNNAYLVVQKASTKAVEANYLAKDGTQIAKVPITG